MADDEALLIKDKKPATGKPRATKGSAKPAGAKTVAKTAKTAAKGKPADAKAVVKARFSKALEEARAGAQALGKEVQGRTEAYREKLTGKSGDLIGDAKALSEQAKERAAALALDGKARASDALTGLGKVVADNAATLDDKLGAKYGDYARTASRQIHEAAARLDAKDLGELGDDAKEFVRKSPGLAIGLAAVAGFVLAQLFKGSDD